MKIKTHRWRWGHKGIEGEISHEFRTPTGRVADLLMKPEYRLHSRCNPDEEILERDLEEQELSEIPIALLLGHIMLVREDQTGDSLLMRFGEHRDVVEVKAGRFRATYARVLARYLKSGCEPVDALAITHV